MTIEFNDQEKNLIQNLLVLHVFGIPLDEKDERWQPLNEMEDGELARIGMGVLEKIRTNSIE